MFSRVALIASGGVVVAIFTVIASASFAALIFSPPLDEFVGRGIWMALITALIVGLLVAITSSYPGAIAIPQDRVAPILAILAASVFTQMTSAPLEDRCLAVIAAIILVSLTTGLFLYALGRMQLGNLIRYIPYPVIGGFLAGSGWLLALGGIRVMTGHAVKIDTLPLLLQTSDLLHWLPGVAFAILLFSLLKRTKNQLLMPLAMVLAIVLFYLVAAFVGKSVVDLRRTHWLPEFHQAAGASSLTFFSVLKMTSWALLLNHLNILATILLTSVVSILLTASALELSAQQEIDFNRELRSAGLATFFAGLAGGMVGFHSLSLSRLALSMGAPSRWVGGLAAVLCGLALFFGASMVSFVPQYVCGGLLFFLGLVFLWEWVYEASRKLTHLDYAVVLFILAVVGAVGYPEGVATGIIAAVVLFVHNYSRVNVVSHALSGATLRSNVDRPVHETRLLREKGEQIYAMRLQGFIFFGTATRLLQEVRTRATNATLQPLSFVIMDFRRVSGLDSSAALSLWKVHQLGSKFGFTLIITQLRPEIMKQLEMAGLRQNELEDYYVFRDLDHGLEWCERVLLGELVKERNGTALHLAEQLSYIWPKDVAASRLLPYLERKEVPKGTHLIRQSELSESLYFIESGQVTARLEIDGGHAMRLRSQGAGTVVGEVGLFLGGRRTASVVTEEASTVYLLSAASLHRMRTEDPTLALAFHQFIVRLLAERLTTASNMLRDFQQ